MEVVSADTWTVGDLAVSRGGQVMRVTAMGEIRPAMATMLPHADPEGRPEYAMTLALVAMPKEAETITCYGCLKRTHLWVDSTQTHGPSGLRRRLIRCARCFTDALYYARACEIHSTSTTVERRHLTPRWWPPHLPIRFRGPWELPWR
ncbi:hypothetical protein [Planotetraspora sp. GP83]|uniref:hypothetical protein n=1 Tax=Planotetraspora sp. GP83 TaxID=3156264 RepID=UPI003517563C